MTSEEQLVQRVESIARRLAGSVAAVQYWHPHATAAIGARSAKAVADAQEVYHGRLRAIREHEHALLTAHGLAAVEWGSPLWANWNPSNDHLHPAVLRIGMWQERGAYDTLELPALVPLLGARGWFLQASGHARTTAASTLQVALLRLLALLPPGKARFVLIDPVGLGQNVTPFMHLADYDEQLITGRAWTEPQQIEQRLVDLTEHIENVIQQYLRNQYATIEEYNSYAGEIAEPYRFLVVLDFPANFSETAARRLISIAQNGPRCGVYPLVVADTDQKLPYGFNVNDIMEQSTVIAWNEDHFTWRTPELDAYRLVLDQPPGVEQFTSIVNAVGEASREAQRVEVPFERIAPAKMQWWQGDSRAGLEVPLGPSGARRVQSFSLGTSTAQHALVVGKTGSGKSTLLHTLITSLALVYSPDEIQLYLIDFKKGVEFKVYASQQLPHARVIAIESEREFGLSVVQGLDAELRDRGDMFRSAGVDHIADFRDKTGQALPRILLIVDEFQEFFTEDDPIATQVAQILDRLVRQGRAFGVHVLLGSQTLAGAYALTRSTVDQMAVRVALQCSEADSRLILADDNPAARLLSRPGEAIYNALNGLVEGNSRFQVAWLPDPERDRYLEQIRQLAETARYRPPQPQIVFEGQAPSDVGKNAFLTELLSMPSPPTSIRRATIWLGDPVAIRDPVSVSFPRQSGSNLLLVGQNEELARGMMTTALLGLAAQYAPETVEFYVLDLSAVDAEWADFFSELAGQLPHTIKVGRRRKLLEFLEELTAEAERRLAADEIRAPARYLMIYGLQRARDLRQDDVSYGYGYGSTDKAPPSPSQLFTDLLRDGPEAGIHTLVWNDTVTNLNRALDRRTLREFALRLALQMSPEDSANLLDTPAASKLGPYRALCYSEEEGRLEKYRPYGLPSPEWLTWATQQLQRR